jgi:hypothetical protein
MAYVIARCGKSIWPSQGYSDYGATVMNLVLQDPAFRPEYRSYKQIGVFPILTDIKVAPNPALSLARRNTGVTTFFFVEIRLAAGASLARRGCYRISYTTPDE